MKKFLFFFLFFNYLITIFNLDHNHNIVMSEKEKRDLIDVFKSFEFKINPIKHDIEIKKENLELISNIFKNFEFKINQTNLTILSSIIDKLVTISSNIKELKINLNVDQNALNTIQDFKLKIEPSSSQISEILKITQSFGINIIIIFFIIKLINFIIKNKIEIYNFITNKYKK